jgi:hypothetical protein
MPAAAVAAVELDIREVELTQLVEQPTLAVAVVEAVAAVAAEALESLLSVTHVHR